MLKKWKWWFLTRQKCIRRGHYSLVKTDDFDFFNTYWAICIFSKNKNHQFEWEIYIRNPGIHTFNEAKVVILGAFGGHFESRIAPKSLLGDPSGGPGALPGRYAKRSHSTFHRRSQKNNFWDLERPKRSQKTPQSDL